MSLLWQLLKVTSEADSTQVVIIDAIYTAVLVLRIWHLYRHSRAAQILAVTSFVICVVAEGVTLGLSIVDLHSEIIVAPGVYLLEIGCKALPPPTLWRMFVPHFVLHTICYLFTAYRGIRSRSIAAEAAPLMRRLLREYVASLGLWRVTDFWFQWRNIIFCRILYVSVILAFVSISWLILCFQFLWASQRLVPPWRTVR